MEKREETLERALLVGVNVNNDPEYSHSMKELEKLTEACNMEVVGFVEQNLPCVNNALYIGTGKVKEVKERAEILAADYIIFDNSLTPSQLRNLQNELDYPILDRTHLILNIFSERAQTKEAKLQVEIAKLEYIMPRLAGMGKVLSRQGGGSGGLSNKGAGEKKIDLDKRKLAHRIHECKKGLEEVAKDRMIQRKKRNESEIPQVALVGYTNAGKSTVMNYMLDRFDGNEEKKVLQKDMLFATLDTTVRKIVPENKKTFLLSDTVGFISKLPHNLVKAFRSTLEEAVEADLLLIVIDYSDPHYKDQLQVTIDTLKEIGAASVPRIFVFNKADRVENCNIPMVKEDKIYLSAKLGIGMDELIEKIGNEVYGYRFETELLVPFSRGDVVSYLNEKGMVTKTEYEAEGTHLWVECTAEEIVRFHEFELSR